MQRHGTLLFSIAVLVFLNVCVWNTIDHFSHPTLRVSILPVGQGDAILVQSPTGQKMLIDGGPDVSVLQALGSELGPLARSLDMVVETDAEQGHSGGLPAVFQQYAVKQFMEPGIPDSTPASKALTLALKDDTAVRDILARRGMRIHLGGGAYADILSPDRDPSGLATNVGSIVMHIVYGNTSFMLPSDIPSSVEDWLVRLDGNDGELASTVLKAGNQGSNYSTDASWLTAVHPQIIASTSSSTVEFVSNGNEVSEQ